MNTGCWNFKPSELKRMIESIQSTGLQVRSVEVTATGLKVNIGEPEKANDQSEQTKQRGEWD
jgi:hypothetical protein